MANIKSAIKRIEIAERNRLRNRSYTSAIKTLTKKCISAIEVCAASPSEEAQEDVKRSVSAAYSRIDKAVKRGVLHPNSGARKKSRIAKLLKKHLESYTPSESSTPSESIAPAAEPSAQEAETLEASASETA